MSARARGYDEVLDHHLPESMLFGAYYVDLIVGSVIVGIRTINILVMTLV